jgi:hypothetical protein
MLLAGCADVPITAEQVESNGQLRPASVSVFDAAAAPATGTALPIQLTSVLAQEAEGALEDRATFGIEAGEVHLHLRTDRAPESGITPQLAAVWSHGDRMTETPVTLTGDATLSLASSLPVAAGDEGEWSVAVFADQPEGRAVLVKRVFEITP